MNKGDVALRINTTIYCINFYFLKQYIVYKIFSATAPFSIFKFLLLIFYLTYFELTIIFFVFY